MTFQTLDGVLVTSLSVGQMREVDRIAIEEAGSSLDEMMESTGSRLARFARVSSS